jgi:dipeptidyl aminopeptidase/acylaminoacyl peptidase
MTTGTSDLRALLDTATTAPSNFSPDGSKVLVQSNRSGLAQLYVVDRASGETRQLTDFDDPVAGAYLPVGDMVVMASSAGGNERSQLFVMNDDGTGLRPMVHDPEVIHRLGGASRDGAWLAYSSNARSPADFDVYLLELETGESRRVFEMGGICHGRGFSPDGRWLAVSRRGHLGGDTQLYLVDVGSGDLVEVAAHDEPGYVGAPAWVADGSSFFFVTDLGRDFAGVARFDLDARAWAYVMERECDLGCVMNWPATRLLVTSDEDGITCAELYDPATLGSMGEVPLPGPGSAEFGFSRDGGLLAYAFTSAVEPGDAWCFDCATGETTRLTTSHDVVASAVMVSPTMERIASFDGECIPTYVYRPLEAEPPSPVVVYLHGGPEAQHTPTFDPVVQYLVATGFAVVAPNVRGSTGYGKRFEHLDDGRNRLDAVADLASVHEWIEATSDLDAARVALFGGSYGGYLVLAGLAFQPERWAAGVDIVGISSLVTFLENTAEWRRKVREAEYGSLAHDRQFLEGASPLTHADRIRAPLFLIHGANDPRVPVAEAEQIHATVSANGMRSELLVYPDEGHGLARLANRLDAYPKVLAFLKEVLRVE